MVCLWGGPVMYLADEATTAEVFTTTTIKLWITSTAHLSVLWISFLTRTFWWNCFPNNVHRSGCTRNIRETKLPQVTVDQSHNSLVNETALGCTVKVFSSILEYPCTKSISFLSLNKKGKRRPRDWMGFSLQWTVIKLWITSTAHLSVPWNSFWDGCSDEIASPTMFINPGALGIYEVINYPQVTVDQSHNSLVNETALRRTVTVFSSVLEYPCCALN